MLSYLLAALALLIAIERLAASEFFAEPYPYLVYVNHEAQFESWQVCRTPRGWQ